MTAQKAGALKIDVLPPSPTKTLSPAELAKLEHAFATDPASEAYKPLAEAYLGMGRYMEAMVVCKKGVKAHPNTADPRVLLARVYADQGKDKKALEELAGALQLVPNDKAVLRMTGALQLKTGETEAGKANLLKAYQADPNDADTKALLQQHNIDVSALRAAPPPPAGPVAGGPPVLHPVQPGSAAPSRGAPRQGPPVLTPAAPPPGAPIDARPTNGGAGTQRPVTRPNIPRTQTGPVRTAQRPRYEPQDDIDESPSDYYRRPRSASASRSKFVFLALLIVGSLGLGGYLFFGQRAAERNKQIARQLKLAYEHFQADSYDSYQKACAEAEKVLEFDDDNAQAHGYLAYAYAIRWGEHGGGDAARTKAEEHLAAAKKDKAPNSYLYAAEALVKTYSGKGPEALSELQQRVAAFDAQGKKSSLLYLTLGIIQMNAGDLEHAKESLDTAQALAGSDPRVYAARGALFRRRGQDNDAWKEFDNALKFRPDHPESRLAKSLLILDQDEPSYLPAARMLKQLLEAQPPPSPRQLATAHLARALLVSRLSSDLPLYTKAEYRKQLTDETGVGTDKSKNNAEVQNEEDAGFRLDPKNPELFLIKGKRLLWENNIDGAAAEIRRAIQLDSSRAHFHVELARTLMKKDGGEKEAESALKKALEMNPGSPKLQAMLGHVYMRQNKLDDAMREYEKAVADPKAKNPEARLSMGRIQREKRQLDNAIASFERAAQEYLGQSYKIATSYNELGRTFELKGDRNKAQEAFEKALNADPSYEDAYCSYAKFLSVDPKNRAKVKAFAEEYLKRAPKSGECVADAQRLAN